MLKQPPKQKPSSNLPRVKIDITFFEAFKLGCGIAAAFFFAFAIFLPIIAIISLILFPLFR